MIHFDGQVYKFRKPNISRSTNKFPTFPTIHSSILEPLNSKKKTMNSMYIEPQHWNSTWRPMKTKIRIQRSTPNEAGVDARCAATENRVSRNRVDRRSQYSSPPLIYRRRCNARLVRRLRTSIAAIIRGVQIVSESYYSPASSSIRGHECPIVEYGRRCSLEATNLPRIRINPGAVIRFLNWFNRTSEEFRGKFCPAIPVPLGHRLHRVTRY